MAQARQLPLSSDDLRDQLTTVVVMWLTITALVALTLTVFVP
jgi:hypothetical protein